MNLTIKGKTKLSANSRTSRIVSGVLSSGIFLLPLLLHILFSGENRDLVGLLPYYLFFFLVYLTFGYLFIGDFDLYQNKSGILLVRHKKSIPISSMSNASIFGIPYLSKLNGIYFIKYNSKFYHFHYRLNFSDILFTQTKKLSAQIESKLFVDCNPH